jgi:hypothetical protein
MKERNEAILLKLSNLTQEFNKKIDELQKAQSELLVYEANLKRQEILNEDKVLKAVITEETPRYKTKTEKKDAFEKFKRENPELSDGEIDSMIELSTDIVTKPKHSNEPQRKIALQYELDSDQLYNKYLVECNSWKEKVKSINFDLEKIKNEQKNISVQVTLISGGV